MGSRSTPRREKTAQEISDHSSITTPTQDGEGTE